MKTERVTLLTSPEFKAFLTAQARREGVSVAELVRRRCEGRATEEHAALAALTAELRAAVRRTRKSVKDGLAEAAAVLHELRARRAARHAEVDEDQATPVRSRRAAAARA
jgi:hypothetical protein